MKKILRKIAYSFLILVILAITLILFLGTTTPGLYTTIKIANVCLPGKIKAKHLSGRLFDNFAFTKLSYQDETTHLIAHDGQVNWSLKDLILKKFKLTASLRALTVDDSETISDLNISASQNKTQWRLDALRFTTAQQNITLQATLDEQLTARLTVHSQATSINKLKGFLDVKGDFTNYQWHGQFTGATPLSLQGSLRNGETLATTIHWHHVNWLTPNHALASASGNVTVNGTWPKLTVRLDSALDAPIQGKLHLRAIHDAQTLHVNAHLTHKSGNINAELTHSPEKTYAKITQGANHAELNGHMPYPWHAHLSIPNPKSLHPQLIYLQTTITANAVISGSQKGKIDIDISPGMFQLPENSTTSYLHFLGGTLHGVLNNQGVSTTGQIAIDNSKIMHANATLPGLRLDKGLSPTQRFTATLDITLQSLDFIAQLSAHIKEAQGTLTAKLTSEGTLKQHKVSGDITLERASFSIPATGLTFAPISAKLHTSHKDWQLKGSIMSQGQTLTLNGDGHFAPEATGKVHVSATDFSVINTTEYLFNVSPDVNVLFDKKNIDITGKIVIPKAKIAPVNFANTQGLTEDAVFVGDNAPKEKPIGTKIDLTLDLGKQFELDTQGLTGNVDGAIQIKQLPHSPISATGELNVLNGRYQAYGQDLNIEQGQLFFAGGLVTNPGINIRAIRRFNNTSSTFSGSGDLLDFSAANVEHFDFSDNTTVGIEVTGRLKSPELKLFSVPPTLSQADILSMLLLGKPSGQASTSGGSVLMAAVSALNLGGGSKGAQLLSQLNQSLGLDIGLQQNAQYNSTTNEVTNNQSLAIGRKISNRMYASYSVGLFENDSNVFTLRYLLNQFFSVQVNASSTASGIDFLYTHRK